MREYFYRIDRGGRLFHDNSRLTDRGFLEFFFARLRVNDTGLNGDYAYVSPCGREMNYVHVESLAFVFHELRSGKLYYNFTGLCVPFVPGQVCSGFAGTLVHPAPGPFWGAFAPALLLELTKSIDERGGLYSLLWEGERFPIRPWPEDEPPPR